MSPAAAASPTVTAPLSSGLRDFSDRLSPMLVKELRQGLKSHVFTWGLIAMQLSLAIMALISMEEGNSRDINSFFWWSVAGVVCVLLPMRCANALRDESSANTLDTLLLTQLSAWRITLGKWLASCALQVLVAMTALPYLILRYFAGGINMPMEMAWLGVYLLFGMLVSAVMLGLSWFPHFLIRAVFMLAVLAGSAGFCGGTIDEISRAYDYGLDDIFRTMGWPGVIYLLVAVSWVAFFFLDIGAARLAPISENRATRRRLVTLAVLGIAGGCCLADFPHREIGAILAMMLAMGMFLPCVQAVSERPANFAPVLQPFVKRGPLGRLAGRVLYPGWHTGLLFSLLLIVASGGLLAWCFFRMVVTRNWMNDPDELAEVVGIMTAIVCGVIGVLVLPVVLWRRLHGLSQWDFWRWLLVIVMAGLFHLGVTLLGSFASPKVYYANYLLPTGSVFVFPVAQMQAREEVLVRRLNAKSDWEEFYTNRRNRARQLMLEHGAVAAVSTSIWLGVAVVLALRELRVTRRAEQELG